MSQPIADYPSAIAYLLSFADFATRYEETLERVAAFLDRPRRSETLDVRLGGREPARRAGTGPRLSDRLELDVHLDRLRAR